MNIISRFSRHIHRWKLMENSYLRSKTFNNSKSKHRFKLRDLAPTILFGVTFYNKENNDNDFLKNINLEEDIMTKAFCGPEPELLELMNVLKDCIVQSCSQYRACIKKQIEIIEKSIENSILSDTIDELPEYRSLASELNNELNNYIVLLKTIGEMTYQHLLNSAKEGGSIQHVSLLSETYKNLEVILQHELDENRKCETDLNIANRNMILNSKVDY
ncbi:hypothetical protein WA026_000774 [Henosepilachna vigintioctopunctata]|uniref:Uncharacterized protein n=1 Tax=Henosepilachna vigintioctopunctata TaxID=420089 RepID=A0AAW1UYP0_9CUCU